jgi:sugar O-acyltransferase (sialic acid O-acetyltransferase NeuD family)
VAELVIFGAGDIARLAHHYFQTDSEHRVAGFVVDAEYRDADEFQGLPLVDFETVTERFAPASCQMFVALSYARMNRVRADTCRRAKEVGYELASYVSSRCTYLAPEPPGENAFILEDNTIQPFVRIGADVTLWSGNHIGHDSVIDDHCFITSHVVVSGNCHAGESCFVGVNATLHNSVELAPRTLVAAGAVITRDTVEGGVYVPPRATLIDKRSDEIEL